MINLEYLRITVTRKATEGLKERIGEHDVQLSQIYDAIENLLDQKNEEKSWEQRERIGFHKDPEAK